MASHALCQRVAAYAYLLIFDAILFVMVAFMPLRFSCLFSAIVAFIRQLTRYYFADMMLRLCLPYMLISAIYAADADHGALSAPYAARDYVCV